MAPHHDLETYSEALVVTADDARAQALSLLRRSVGCDGALFFNAHPSREGLVFGSIVTDVQVDRPSQLAPNTMIPRSPGAHYPHLSAPKAFERNAFVVGKERWVSINKAHPLVQAAYPPNRVYDDIRMLCYEKGTFLGWIGAVRQQQGSKRYFSKDDALRLRPIVRQIVGHLAVAHELDSTTSQGAYLVVGPNGTVESLTQEAQQWLTETRRSKLCAWVQRFAKHGGDGTLLLDDFKATALKLESRGRCEDACYLIRLQALPWIQESSAPQLTYKQREIAILAATGATAIEIATASNSTEGTIKVHLKAIYKKLQIASRAELAREVDTWNVLDDDGRA